MRFKHPGFYSENRVPKAERYDGKSIDRHVREKIEAGTLAEMDTTALSFMLIGEKNHVLLERPSRQFKSLQKEFRSNQPVLSEGEWVSYMVGLRNDAMAHRTSSQMPTVEYEESCRAVELFLKMLCRQLDSTELLDDFENARKPLASNFSGAEELSRQWEENLEHIQESIQEMREEMQDLAESNAAGLDAISQRVTFRTLADAEEAGARAKAQVLRNGVCRSKEEDKEEKDGEGSLVRKMESAQIRKMHITYSREDSELVMKVQGAVSKTNNWQISGVLFNQTNEWFSAWYTALEKADGVCVFFTEGNAAFLSNGGVGYKEKLSSRFREQSNDAALYREAIAILKLKAQRSGFKIYVVDGIKYTAEQLAINLIDDAPSFGPVDKWRAFIEGGCEWAVTTRPTVIDGGGIVAVFCSYVADRGRIAAGLSAEVPGGNRLQGERKTLPASTRILWPASAESMVDTIEQCNPAIVHIAGHNQYLKDNLRLVGFSAGDDGDGLTEIRPEELAEFIVGSAVATGGGGCALECVLLNTCRSVAFAQVLLDYADRCQRYNKKLRVVCWPDLTDDLVCQRYAKGFYKHMDTLREESKRTHADSDWIGSCHENGVRQVRIKKVELTPALVRGDPNPKVTQVKLPQLLDAQSIGAMKSGQKIADESTDGGQALGTKEEYVLVRAVEAGRQHYEALQDSLELVLPPTALESIVDEMSWRIKLGGSLQQNAADLARLIEDLQSVCGADATVEKLTEGSIVVHLISPISDYCQMRTRFDFSRKHEFVGGLRYGGLEVISVELGDWVIIDMSKLDEESTQRLRDRFHEAGLEHLLTVLLAEAPLQDVLLEAQPEQEVALAKKGDGHATDFGEPGSAADDAIQTALTSGATEEEIRRQALAAAMKAGADEKEAAAIAETQFCLAQAKERWEEGQSTIEKQRPPASKFGMASKDLLCPITNEIYVDPVMTSDGMTYERVAIERWFAGGNNTSPLTGLPVDTCMLKPDISMKRRLDVDIYPFKLHTQDVNLIELVGHGPLVELLQQVLPADATVTDVVSRSDWRGKMSTTVFLQIHSVRVLQELRDALLIGKLARKLLHKVEKVDPLGYRRRKLTSAIKILAHHQMAQAWEQMMRACKTIAYLKVGDHVEVRDMNDDHPDSLVWKYGVVKEVHPKMKVKPRGWDKPYSWAEVRIPTRPSALRSRHTRQEEMLPKSTSVPSRAATRRQNWRRDNPIEVDVNHFVGVYERCLLMLDELTPHQLQKLRECLEEGAWVIKQDVYLRGPAGSGKTFVALHLVLLLLSHDPSANVLFVVKNTALAYFVAKWLWARVTKRGSHQEEAQRALSRFHVLCGEAMERFSFEVEDLQLHLKPMGAQNDTLQYSLLVVDEAHDLTRGTNHEIKKFTQKLTPPRLLLSDVSQQSTAGNFDLMSQLPPTDGKMRPPKEVVLSQVVRNSRSIVEGARVFQTNYNDEPSGCCHGADGPPLKVFQFSRKRDGLEKLLSFQGEKRLENFRESPRIKIYAEKAVEALDHLAGRFRGLELNGRVAIIVPSSSFLQQFKPALLSKLQSRKHSDNESETFHFVDAAQACRSIVTSTRDRKQCLVLDTIDNFNGLERLIVIAIGLDSPIDHGPMAHGVASRTRSDLYRAITRAQMLVVVVNELVSGGWLEFLSCVTFDEGTSLKHVGAKDKAKTILDEEAEEAKSVSVAGVTLVRALGVAPDAALIVSGIVLAVGIGLVLPVGPVARVLGGGLAVLWLIVLWLIVPLVLHFSVSFSELSVPILVISIVCGGLIGLLGSMEALQQMGLGVLAAVVVLAAMAVLAALVPAGLVTFGELFAKRAPRAAPAIKSAVWDTTCCSTYEPVTPRDQRQRPHLGVHDLKFMPFYVEGEERKSEASEAGDVPAGAPAGGN
jgi:hypothetical protein